MNPFLWSEIHSTKKIPVAKYYYQAISLSYNERRRGTVKHDDLLSAMRQVSVR